MNICPVCLEIIWSGALTIVYRDDFGRRYHAKCFEKREDTECKFSKDLVEFHSNYDID